MKNAKKYTFASMFGKDQVTNDIAHVKAMQEEIRSVGGILHFTVVKEAGHWFAQCDEIEGIITGGEGEEPADEEVSGSIREAIHTAFHISSNVESETVLRNADEPALPAFRLCHA